MNMWLIVAAVSVAAVVLFLIIGSRRSRSSADELDQQSHSSATGPTPMRKGLGSPGRLQNSGSVDQSGLRSLIGTIGTGRETGALGLTYGAETAALYFLFGHLFHAICGNLAGEPAVLAILGWPGASYIFERESKLPTEETIKRPFSDILPPP